MSSDLSSCQRDIDTKVHVTLSWGLQLNAEKCCGMRFARNKSFIERLCIAQFWSYYVRELGLPLVDSCKDLGILVDTEMSVKLVNSTLCRSREYMINLYIRHIRPILQFGSCVWNLKYISDMNLRENVHRRRKKIIDGFENLT